MTHLAQVASKGKSHLRINKLTDNKKIARIEVKSRQYKDAKMYQLRSFKSDFVVFVQLNKYTRYIVCNSMILCP